MSEKSIEECKSNIIAFANEHDLIYNFEGTVGFGRECVGILDRETGCYLAYNPTDKESYDYIPEYYDQRMYDIKPEYAYHKGDYLCVLGHEDESIRQLDKWCDDLRNLDVQIIRYKNGNEGIQALFTSEYTYTLVPKNKLPFDHSLNG